MTFSDALIAVSYLFIPGAMFTIVLLRKVLSLSGTAILGHPSLIWLYCECRTLALISG